MAFVRRRIRRRVVRPARRFRRRQVARRRRFYRTNNLTRAAFRSKVIPRTLYAKLNWAYTTTVSNNYGQNPQGGTVFIGGNYIRTPFVNPMTGDNVVDAPFPMGLIRYGTFFRRSRVLAAKLSLSIGVPISTGQVTRYALITSPGQGIDTDQNYNNIFNAPYDSISAWPGARLAVSLPNSNRILTNIRHYGKTKSILGKTNVRDSINLSQDIPDALLPMPSDPALPSDSSNSWMFALRYFSPGATANVNYDVNFRVTYYVELFQRDYVEQFRVPEPAGLNMQSLAEALPPDTEITDVLTDDDLDSILSDDG